MKRLHILLLILIFIITILSLDKIKAKIQKDKEKLREEIIRKEKQLEEKEKKIEIIIENYCKECGEISKLEIKKIKNDKNIFLKNNFYFKNREILFFNPSEPFWAYLSQNYIKNNKNNLLIGMELFINDAGEFILENSYKDNPYFTLPETKRKFCYKISNYTLYLKDPLEKDGKWEPVKIKYIKELKPDPNREHAQYPCMLVYLETKWFKGEYEIMCE